MEEASIILPYRASLLDLPDEVIQYILSLLPPYNDLKTCMQVCKRLYHNVQSVLNYTNISLNRAISEFDIVWRHLNPEETCTTGTITRRYSHSACFHDNSMYIFGGCTFSSTTFNDLWRLDLSTRKWFRLLTSGQYPSPKACASIVAYKFSLILFGGLTQPSPNPVHQTWRVFNELHVYNINKNYWSVISKSSSPPPLAGHSATVHGNQMIVFGGIVANNVSTNDIWCLNLDTLDWHKQVTTEPRPNPRYGSSQIYIDESHLLILGGCGGVHNVFNDAWLLTMNDSIFIWKQVNIRNKQYAAPHIFCHPAARVNSRYVVTISQNPNAKYISGCLFRRINPGLNVPLSEEDDRNRRRHDDRDVNINGIRGELIALRREFPENANNNNRQPSDNRPRENASNSRVDGNFDEQPERMLAFHSEQLNCRSRRRGRQLEVLQKMENMWKNKTTGTKVDQPTSKISKMALFVLDISELLNEIESYIVWKAIKNVAQNSPEPTILYSLVLGKGELIMFGGMYKDTSSNLLISNNEMNYNSVSNHVHFINVPTLVI